MRVRERLFDRWGSDLLSHIRYVNLFFALIGAKLLTPSGLLAILDEEEFSMMDSAFREGCRQLGWSGDEAPVEAVRKACEATQH